MPATRPQKKPLWCTRCKAVFVGEACEAGHAPFMYTSKIPRDVEGAELQLAAALVAIVQDTLSSMPLMKGLSKEQLASVAKAMESVSYPEGEAICRQGARGDFFYIIADGKVNVHVDKSSPPYTKPDAKPRNTIRGETKVAELQVRATGDAL